MYLIRTPKSNPQTSRTAKVSAMATSKLVYLRQKSALPYLVQSTAFDTQLYGNEVQLIKNYHFEAMAPFGMNHLLQVKKSTRACWLLTKNSSASTKPWAAIHRNAGELYEKSYASGHFTWWPQNTVILRCLFIAFSDTRSTLYIRQRDAWAPRMKKRRGMCRNPQDILHRANSRHQQWHDGWGCRS